MKKVYLPLLSDSVKEHNYFKKMEISLPVRTTPKSTQVK